MKKYSILGKAKNIEHRSTNHWSILTFKLTNAQNQNDIPIYDVSVRLKGYQIVGTRVDENDEIKIYINIINAKRVQKKEISLAAVVVHNLTTGEKIKTGPYYQGEVMDIQQLHGVSITERSASHPALRSTTTSRTEEILRFNIKTLDYGESKVLFVEMKGVGLHGYINNGDVVAVFAKKKRGKPLNPSLVKNLTTNVDVKIYNSLGFIKK